MVNTLFTNDLNGGDIAVKSDGIQRGDFLQTAVYCALFGGNVEENTKPEYRRYESNKSYWGNAFLRRQFNSETERALRNNTTAADGLSEIRKAVFTDLQKLIPTEIDKITEVYVSQSATNPKRIKITIFIEAQRIHKQFIFEAGENG